jgi:hypothetical protein
MRTFLVTQSKGGRSVLNIAHLLKCDVLNNQQIILEGLKFEIKTQFSSHTYLT